MDEKSDHTNSNSCGRKDRKYEKSIDSESEDDSQDEVKNKLTQNSNEAEVTNVQPMDRKPKFDFAALKCNSHLISKLPSFLAEMDAANRQLEAEKTAGTLGARRLEIDDDEKASEGGQYIEMNLGLGVLEEKNSDSDTSSEGESSEDEDVMDKLMGTEKDNKDDGEKKKVVIEEL